MRSTINTFRLRVLSTMLLSLFVHFTNAQITFEKKWGGDGYQDGQYISSTSDGGFIIAGISTSDSTPYTNIVLMRVDSLGDSLWTKNYGGPGSNDFPSAVVQTRDGGFLVSSTTYSLSSQAPNYSDWWILRTDANGDTLWTKMIRKPNNDRMWDISENDDGSFLACGWLSVNGYAKATMMKFSETGDSLWSVQIGSSANSYAQFCQQNYDGNYLLAGAFLSGTFQGIVMEYDTAGTLLNSHIYDKQGTVENINSVHHLAQGGYIISAKSGTINGYDVWVLRTNDNWDTLWTQTYNDPFYLYDTEAKFAFDATSDNGFIFGGAKFTGASSEAVLYRMDSTGASLWTSYYGGNTNGEDKTSSVLSLADGGFILSGQTEMTANNDGDIYLVRTNANGLVTSLSKSDAIESSTQFLLFPNPSKNKVHWESKYISISCLRLLSMSGSILHTYEQAGTSGELNFAGLVPGIYIVEFVSEISVQRKRLIIAGY